MEHRSPVRFYPIEEVFEPVTQNMVPDVKPYYSISTYGKVYSSYSNKFLKPGTDTKGYLYVSLARYNKNQKNERVHRLVTLAFDNDDNKASEDICNHLDGDKLHDTIYNLERTDYSGNTSHAYEMGLIKNPGPKSKISDEDIEKVCQLLVENKLSSAEIAEVVGTSVDTVYRINIGRSHTEISDKYNLHNRKDILSKDDIENICRYFNDNPRNGKLKNQYISEALNYNNIPIDNRTLNIGERILYHQSYKKISSKYNF